MGGTDRVKNASKRIGKSGARASGGTDSIKGRKLPTCDRGDTRSDQRTEAEPVYFFEFGADIGAGPRPVLDDEGLAEAFRKPLTHQTCDDVVSATGCIRDN